MVENGCKCVKYELGTKRGWVNGKKMGTEKKHMHRHRDNMICVLISVQSIFTDWTWGEN